MIYKINSRNYLLVEVPIADLRNPDAMDMQMSNHECIMQGVEAKDALSNSDEAPYKAKVYVPANRINEFKSSVGMAKNRK